LCRNIKKIKVTLRINYDNQTLKKRQVENILNDIEPENRMKIHIDLQRVWQTTENRDNAKDDISTLISTAKTVGYKNVSCAGGLNAGQFYNCYVSKYHYINMNYDGKIYKCTARNYIEPYEIGVMNDDGTIVWNESRISKLYSKSTFDNPVCPKCAYLPLCWGPCPQKMVELKESGIDKYCIQKDAERSMRERIIDLYESSIKRIKSDVIM
jgi:uncharacterized protein